MGNVTVSDFLKNLRGVDIESLTDTIIKENHDQIVDLNRRDQILNRGVDADGKTLGGYAKSTQSFYDDDVELGIVNDFTGADKSYNSSYNLFWTGKSYKGFKAWRDGLMLYITTNARGIKLLIQNGGENIFGLTTKNDNIVNWKIIAPKLNEKIRNKLL